MSGTGNHDWWSQLPYATQTVIKELRKEGFTAYLVGGAVRDLLLGVTPKDFDVATDATPDQIKFLFSKTVEVGAKFGVMIVLIGSEQVEVATFRRDGTYADGRHPDQIEFSSPKEDALRRDFTINGLFWDSENGEIIDHVYGMLDIQRRIIQTIGKPEQRFREDALRILRAIRFYSQLEPYGFEVERKTLQAIRDHRNLLKNTSKERITEELFKIFKSKKPSKGLRLIHSCQLAGMIFLELSELNVVIYDEMLQVIDLLPESYSAVKPGKKPPDFLYWAALLAYDEGKTLQNGFVLSKSDQKSALHVANTDLDGIQNMRVAKLKRILANRHIHEVLCLLHARHQVLKKPLDPIDFCLQKIREFEKNNSLQPAPFLTGKDLKSIGYEPGPEYQKILDEVYDLQLEEKLGDKTEAIEYAKSNFPPTA